MFFTEPCVIIDYAVAQSHHYTEEAPAVFFREKVHNLIVGKVVKCKFRIAVDCQSNFAVAFVQCEVLEANRLYTPPSNSKPLNPLLFASA